MKAEKFKIEIPQARIDDLRNRLLATSWPGDFGNEDWHYGVEQGWLKDMVAYWATEFDWRAQEARMNALPQYRVVIDGIPIHFMHIKSGRPDAIPLILTHGWPWTFWDWHDLAQNLANGDSDGPAFDIVVPSLPGVAFSSPLTTTGVNPRVIAQLWVKLMVEVLGYPRFAAAGGDWGSAVTSELGHAHPDRILAIHLSTLLLPGFDPTRVGPQDFAADEQWMLPRIMEAIPLITSHFVVHASDPQTLAYALADSPVGTAAWLWERRRAWSDCGGDIVGLHGRDFLCTLASLYWLTNTIGSSLRIYKEQFGNPSAGFEATGWPLLHDGMPSVTVPTGVAVAPSEVVLLPRKVVAEQVNLQRWKILPAGGHFLPAEQPGLLADEYRAFFGGLER